MQFALGKTGERIEAKAGLTGVCPSCRGEVVPKCGDMVVHHWAHKSSLDCDPWHEPEGQWHRSWKEKFHSHEREVSIGKHRADVVYQGIVVEFQRSPISISEAIDREEFYQSIAWVFFNRWQTTKLRKTQHETYLYAPKATRLFACLKGQVFLEFEAKLFRVAQIERFKIRGWFVPDLKFELNRLSTPNTISL